MFNNYQKKLLTIAAYFLCSFSFAQNKYDYFKDAVQAKRDTFYNRTLRSILKTVSMPLDSTTDENWINTFYSINLLNTKNIKIDAAIKKVSSKIVLQSTDVKIGFLNLINNKYQKSYFNTVKNIIETTDDVKLQAMCVHYLAGSFKTDLQLIWLRKKTDECIRKNPDNPIMKALDVEMFAAFQKTNTPNLASFFDKNYLPNTTIVFSFQRQNRNYPGLAMIRKADGTFAKNDDGTYFATGQLARSLSNMPGYISNGNTPQGIFTMHGFDTTENYFIGPTTNIQLRMPNEEVRLNDDSTIINTMTLEQYKNLLPTNFANYEPMYTSYYAGKAGRTEIIAHGTTVNPNYYKTNSYFPYTPTMGCLTSVEIWNNKTGYLETSNQKKLTDALAKNGGAYGYLILIEIDTNENSSAEKPDTKRAVELRDVVGYMK